MVQGLNQTEKESITCEYLIDDQLCKAANQTPEGRYVRKKLCSNVQKNYCCYLCSNRENCEISCSYLEGADQRKKEPITCEYLMDGRLCKVQPEGKELRKKHCSNIPKNYCCYLCSNRENCEISCSYLDTSRKQLSLDTSTSLRIDGEINRYQEEMSKLSILLANGKIGEKSYLAATSTLEHKIEELKKTKENPNILTPETASLQSGEFEELPEGRKPTSLWYMVPFFFGIIGGILGYVGTKDKDKGMADRLLAFGIVWTVISVLIYVFVVASIIFH